MSATHASSWLASATVDSYGRQLLSWGPTNTRPLHGDRARPHAPGRRISSASRRRRRLPLSPACLGHLERVQVRGSHQPSNHRPAGHGPSVIECWLVCPAQTIYCVPLDRIPRTPTTAAPATGRRAVRPTPIRSSQASTRAPATTWLLAAGV